MNKIWIIIEALHQGKSLQDPATWKRFGVLVSIFGAIFSAVTALVPNMYVSAVDQSTIVEGIATLGFVINGYLHIATTEKIGL